LELIIAMLRTSIVFGFILFISACSADTWQRTGYETIKNIGAQQCQKSAMSDCQKTEDYDSYKRQQKALELPPQ